VSLFKRKRDDETISAAEAASDVRETVEAMAASGAADKTGDDAPQTLGPFDAADVTELGTRVDLGAIWLPVRQGMQLRMEIDKSSGKITGVSTTLGSSGLQVQVFAAPRTWGIWDEIREEIAAGIREQGGTVDDVPGSFGRELIAKVPAVGAGGQQTQRPARFIGVDGPRWFLRGVFSGKAAIDTEAARELEAVFADIVVKRDDTARPPRDLLALTVPGRGEATAEADAPEGAVPAQPDFNPLKRGPEITEIR